MVGNTIVAARKQGPDDDRDVLKRFLFLCSRNRLRSSTAERVFDSDPNIEVASAGLAADAELPVTPELLAWAELIFVMETAHRATLNRRFKAHLRHARVICLDIPDNYGFMDPELVAFLRVRAGHHLARATGGRSSNRT